jgi:hypothetical protein
MRAASDVWKVNYDRAEDRLDFGLTAETLAETARKLTEDLSGWRSVRQRRFTPSARTIAGVMPPSAFMWVVSPTPHLLVTLGVSGRSPTKRLWIGQAASPSSWKTPFIATRMAS